MFPPSSHPLPVAQSRVFFLLSGRPQRGSCRSGTRAGFTLLEVLIALIIALIAGAAFLQTVGSSMRATGSAIAYDQAVLRAESHLAAAAHFGTLRAGTWSGDDGGGYHWQLQVVPINVTRPAAPAANGAPSTGVALYRVVTLISWREGLTTRHVSLVTEQVGAP